MRVGGGVEGTHLPSQYAQLRRLPETIDFR